MITINLLLRLALVVGLALALLSSVRADVYGPGCKLAWDYADAEMARVVGFRLFVNDQLTKEIAKPTKEVACTAAGLATGANRVWVVAYSADQTSPKSSVLAFDYNPAALGGPTNLRITITTPTTTTTTTTTTAK